MYRTPQFESNAVLAVCQYHVHDYRWTHSWCMTAEAFRLDSPEEQFRRLGYIE